LPQPKSFMTVEESKENSILNTTEIAITMKESVNPEDLPIKVIKSEGDIEAEDVEEVEDVEDPVKDLSSEDIKAIISAGTQALALSNYDEAAEKLSIAVEAQ
jgi:hypothetical protein